MPLADIWTVTSGGVTKTADAWGISTLTRHRESAKTGTLTFTMPGAAVDSAPVFAEYSTFSLYKSGVCWFSGLVTKIPRKGAARTESVSYTISDPWWWLENIAFQQQWVSANPDGGAGALQTTTRTRLIVTQGLQGVNLPGVKMNLGQVMTDVLAYALYACQGLAFPSYVSAGGDVTLPDPTMGTPPPFQIGALTPTLVVPYFEVKDKTCAELIKMLLRYVPDVVTWFDFTSTIERGGVVLPCPTLNIDARANLANKPYSVLGGNVVNQFNPTARYDLQVPAVIAKYEQTDTVDGVSFDVLTVDKYPADVADNTPRALVQTIDLVGGSATYQKQNIVVQPRPVSGLEAEAKTWLLNHHPALVDGYDTDNMTITGLVTTVTPGQPALAAPYDMPTDGSGFNFELLDGQVTPWMWDNGGYLAAEATLLFSLVYSGDDLATQLYFSTFGGVLKIPVQCKITNAATQTYSQLVSFQQAEAPPIGNAEILYNILSQLHQEGELVLQEQECSDPLPPGCVWNATDGLAEWQAMNALVLSVEEDIDKGATKVQFGPTLNLGLATMAEIYRANQKLYSWKLNQRTSGQGSSSNTVQGASQSAASSPSLTPKPHPPTMWQLIIRVTPGSMGPGFTYQGMIFVGPDQMNVLLPDGSTLPISSGANTWFPLLTADDDCFWLQIDFDDSGPIDVTIESLGNGDGGDFDPTISTPWINKSYVQNDGATPPNQTSASIVLATTVAGSPPQVRQVVSSALKLVNHAIAGEAAIYPST